MARTQKNKATEYHIGRLKAQLAKLRSELIAESTKASGGKGEGFDVQKYGNARIALIGYPSVGKSTLQNKLTNSKSAVAAYEFTTLTCVPAIFTYRDAKFQLLDLPGIIDGASEGVGRGREVIAVARSSDIVLMVLDATRDESQKARLTKELEAVGIRLNSQRPQISITKKNTGGITYNSTVPLTKLDEKTINSILNTYKMFNADITFKDDYSADELIDVIDGNRRYLKCIYVYNKIDMLTIDQIDTIARRPYSVCVSSYMNWNMPTLLELIWQYLAIVRVYTKKPGEQPSFDEPIVLTEARGGFTIKSLILQIHQSLLHEAKYALVWGRSVKHQPQQVSLDHRLSDEDVVQICK